MTWAGARPPSLKHLRRILPHLCSLPNSPKPSTLPSRPTPSPTRKSKE